MKDSSRTAIVAAARGLASKVQAGDAAGVKAATIASVASNFNAINGAIQGLVTPLGSAVLNVTSVFELQAADVKAGTEEVQFFCGGGPTAPRTTFTIPQLPPGHYGFATVEATGVKAPQRLSFLLQEQSGAWQLAGFFPRPLLAAGHDGVWYWQRARAEVKAAQPWTAFFYYQAAAGLLLPADFIQSGNSEKLAQEQATAMPPGLPGSQPMLVIVAGEPLAVTNIHTDSSFGGLDLVVTYNAANVNDAAAARMHSVALMKALLVLHPDWKTGFHGLWVFANAPNQQPFALELPMADIAAQT